jgi:hypothetical protein
MACGEVGVAPSGVLSRKISKKEIFRRTAFCNFFRIYFWQIIYTSPA